MIQLPNVTLIAVATVAVEKAVDALMYSSRHIDFAAIKLVSHYSPRHLREEITHEYVPAMGDIDVWNHYLFYHLWKHVDTQYALLIHEDGFVVNPQSWCDDFLQYDYVGAPWSVEVATAIQGGRAQQLSRVGNSVSIRSRKLMMLPSEVCIPWRKYNGDYNEDTQICAHNREVFENNGCRFAPVSVAARFGREHVMPENKHITHPFTFHKWHDPSHPNWEYPRF